MTTLLEQDLRDTFGFPDLSPAEQEVFLDTLGNTVIESALIDLIAGMDEQQQAALNYYLDTEPSPEALLEHLLTQYERFEHILTATIIAVKEDVISVLGEDTKLQAAKQASLEAEVMKELPAEE